VVRLDIRFAGVLACFLLSGFAALLYETAWTRQFAFVFGTSELAVATVLAAYFGGLTVGAAAAARLAPRVRRPIFVYGLLELGIALAALSVPWLIQLARGLYVAFFSASGTPPEAGGLPSALFYLVCSFAILLVPTALMGATLPLLARHAVRRDQDLGPRIGWLYAINTSGAVAGTLCAAFWLLPSLGLRSTILVGVAVNALVFVVAAALARGAPPIAAAAPKLAAARRPLQLILPFILISGVASFGYEVLWTRLLGHVLGGSVYAFATMLASFLLGIAIGSALAARYATTPARAARGFIFAQLLTACLSWLAFAAVDALPAFARSLGAGGSAGLLANAAVAATVLLPSALCIGTTFPFAVRVLAQSNADAGPASARVYAWNTVGAIVGSVGTGFFVLPALGYAGTLATAVAINLGLAASAALALQPASRRFAIAAGAALVGLALLRPGEPWNVLRHSPIGGQKLVGDVSYFAVGRSATVILGDDGVEWRLRTNGLPEAAIRRPGARAGRASVARWLTLLPALARPEARSMLVVGLGGGLAVESVPSSVRSIDVVELEPEVIDANRHVAEARARDPLADPRVRLRVNDARGALLLTESRYDAIVSQPSHPWTPGASHLYTREFFSLAREHLAPNGVFVQWMGLGFVDEPLLRSLVATFTSVFPHVRAYRPERVAVLLIGSEAPLSVEDSATAAIAAATDEFASQGIFVPEDLAAAFALDDDGARRFARRAPIITDDFNRLQMRSPHAMRNSLTAPQADRLFEAYDPLRNRIAGLDCGYLVRRIAARGEPQRALRLAKAKGDPRERRLCILLAKLAVGRPRKEIAPALEEAFAHDADSVAARFALARIRRREIIRGEPEAVALTRAAPDPAAAVFEGWRHRAARDWDALRALERRLAAATPTDPALDESLRLRAHWRLQSREPARAREARALLDRLLLGAGTVEDLLLRAQASALAEEPVGALDSLREALDKTRRREAARQLALAARALLASIPEDSGAARERLRARVEALLEDESG
jgi:spermidine synthase